MFSLQLFSIREKKKYNPTNPLGEIYIFYFSQNS